MSQDFSYAISVTEEEFCEVCQAIRIGADWKNPFAAAETIARTGIVRPIKVESIYDVSMRTDDGMEVNGQGDAMKVMTLVFEVLGERVKADITNQKIGAEIAVGIKINSDNAMRRQMLMILMDAELMHYTRSLAGVAPNTPGLNELTPEYQSVFWSQVIHVYFIYLAAHLGLEAKLPERIQALQQNEGNRRRIVQKAREKYGKSQDFH